MQRINKRQLKTTRHQQMITTTGIGVLMLESSKIEKKRESSIEEINKKKRWTKAHTPIVKTHGRQYTEVNKKQKVPNHIYFKLEFMMFITNDVECRWEMNAQKFVPRYTFLDQRERERPNQSGKFIFRHQLFYRLMHTGVMDPTHPQQFRSKYYRFHVCFYCIIFIQNPYIPKNHWLIRWIAVWMWQCPKFI